MQKVLVRVLTFIVFAGLVMAERAYADPPKTEKGVPVYADAALDAAGTAAAVESLGQAVNDSEAEYRQLRTNYGTEGYSQILAANVTQYSVAAWPEDVFRWYVQKLKAGRGEVDKKSIEFLKSGTFTPITYTVDAVDETDLFKTQDKPSQSEGGPKFLHYDGALAKRIYETRKRTEDGWIDQAYFRWAIKAPDTTVTVMEVELQSRAFKWEGGIQQYSPLTLVNIKTSKLRFHRAWEFQNTAMDDVTLSKFRTIFDTPPTEKTLGVALYPGTVLDFDAMVVGWKPGMPGMIYQYRTKDPVAKVVGYFEKKTGSKAQATGPNVFAILLKGTPKAPENYLWVQEFPGDDKPITMIFIGIGMNKSK
ncbi:MAG: hypothetical protein WCT14_16900 [Treponemataceae bacterium]